MAMHCANARRVAEFLEAHPRVEAVHYPGLASHPNHAVAAKQMRDFGGMLSFRVRGGRDAALAVAGRLQLFTNATSLGGCESLIEHRASVEGPKPISPENLLRCSVGLEHADDLLDDLRAGARLGQTPIDGAGSDPFLPAADVRHRGPGLGRRQRGALLQQLDRDRVGRAHEGHAAVARRAVDGHAERLQVRAGGVDVVDARRRGGRSCARRRSPRRRS